MAVGKKIPETAVLSVERGRKGAPTKLGGKYWGYREDGEGLVCVFICDETCILFELILFSCVFFIIQRYRLPDTRNKAVS